MAPRICIPLEQNYVKSRRKLEPENPEFRASVQNPYLFTSEAWLRFKNKQDGIDKDLWRIGDNLYDLTGFIQKHPGGKDWIEFTKGTDITEAFEVAHIFGNENKTKILQKYHVRSCSDFPRFCFYTFHQNGFYQTLKRRVQQVLKEVGRGPTPQVLRLQDGLVLAFHILMFISIYTNSIIVTIAAGLVLGMTFTAAHNFFHKADNFRQYYFDLSLFSSYDWRITHMISHHLHTNTYADYELTAFHPILDYSTGESKTMLHSLLGPFLCNIVFFSASPYSFVTKIIAVLRGESKVRPENLIPFLQLCMFMMFSGLPISHSCLLWLLMHCCSSFWLTFTTVQSTHRHPSLYVAGDEPQQDTDWGLWQLDCGRDVRTDNLFLVMTTFKHHRLHHLFPTIDHSKLHHLYPVFEKTCEEFGVDCKFAGMWEMVFGHYIQLTRRRIHDITKRLSLREQR